MLSFKALIGDIRHFYDAATGVRNSRVVLNSVETVPSAEGVQPKYSITTTVTADQATELKRLGAATINLVPVAAGSITPEATPAVETLLAPKAEPEVPVVDTLATPTAVSDGIAVAEAPAVAALVVDAVAGADTPAATEPAAAVEEPAADPTTAETVAAPLVDNGAGPSAPTAVGV